jgi:hypothetical protein
VKVRARMARSVLSTNDQRKRRVLAPTFFERYWTGRVRRVMVRALISVNASKRVDCVATESEGKSGNRLAALERNVSRKIGGLVAAEIHVRHPRMRRQ